MGIHIPLGDLAVHTYIDLNEYVANLLKKDKKDELPKQTFYDLAKATGKRYG